MSFDSLNLASPIIKAINLCGYAAPTPIQEQAIPPAMAGKDLIASAQTGTGKTAAFVIPALERLQKPSTARGKGPRVLILTPTRELANQVTEAVRTYGRFMRLRHGAIVGGMPYFEQQRLLSQPVDIIIATPGRLIDHLESGRIDFSRVELLVLDEADRMLDMGFSEAVETITRATPEGRQTLLFTATWDNTMARLAQRLMKDPVRIAVAGKKATLEAIEQRLHAADDMQHKTRMLNHLIADSGMTRAIIFSSTKRNADQLARELHAQGHAAEALHGDMNQGARNRTIMNMRRGKVRLLVATDVAARGLDVPGITHVINYDLPKNAEDYVHRIGRTGRAGATGIAISFVSFRELDQLTRIERYIGQSLPQQVIAGLEPARPLRSSNSRSDRPGTSAYRGRPSASGANRYGQRTTSRDTYGTPTGRKPHSPGAYAGDRKRDAKSQGGWAGDYRKPQGDRRSRWA
ncbi:MAG: DEAD/DEAH box helicase [Nitrospirae bacterium]|nr:DEAD/DEAH box helicase [Nitrospirota bacterium]NTW65926.1 DEAD/DEAH box helicase [Nitrospirota bacterium]